MEKGRNEREANLRVTVISDLRSISPHSSSHGAPVARKSKKLTPTELCIFPGQKGDEIPTHCIIEEICKNFTTVFKVDPENLYK